VPCFQPAAAAGVFNSAGSRGGATGSATLGATRLNRKCLFDTGWLWWLPVILYYAVGFAGLAYEPFYRRSIEIINSGPVRNHLETAFIEHLEALLWLIAVVLYTAAALRRASKKMGVVWLVFFACVCFAALGAETSWGQYYFNFSPHGAMEALNVQKEYNLHNLHISKMLGISEGNPLYRHLGNAAVYLNPLFYLFCVLAWLVIPIGLDRFRHVGERRFFKNYPRQNGSFFLAFSLSIAVFLFVDFFVFDAGELFELTLATAGSATAFNCLRG